MIKQIKSNNEIINSVIQKIILQLVEMKTKTIDYKDGKPYITTIPRKILEIEAKKIYMTYKAEFIDLLDDNELKKDKNIKITSYLADEIDAHGFSDEVTFSSGAGELLSKLDSNSVSNEDKVTNLTDDEKVENNLLVKDYINHLLLNKKQDIDFFLDSLPHEVMHCFGFKGGSIFEGITETFTREISRKYGIRNAPFAHQDETRLAQRIEKIIGRDNLSLYSYFPDGNTNVTALSDVIDAKINTNQKGMLKEYADIDNELFELDKKGNQDTQTVENRLNKMYINLNETYEDYIDQNQDELYPLGERVVSLDQEKSKEQQEKLQQILELQIKELEFLNYVYDEITNARDNVEIKSKLDDYEIR